MLLATLALLAAPVSSQAHFGMVIPSESMLVSKDGSEVNFDIAFSHPFSRMGMDMAKPADFFVFVDGSKHSLTADLKEAKYMGHAAWRATYTIKKPGVYQFAVVPQPYFEQAEDCFIIHYAKTVVAAYGAEDDWDIPLGLPVEIIPLTRPFGNYAGNVFQGLVLANGKPCPGISVEMENLNKNGAHKAPNEYFETQTIKTDANGVFTAGIPWAGWWGFAALVEGEKKLEHEGKAKDVELGGIIWLDFSAPEKTGK